MVLSYPCSCCSISAVVTLPSSFSASTYGMLFVPRLTGSGRLHTGKNRITLKKRCLLQGLQVQCNIAGGFGEGNAKLEKKNLNEADKDLEPRSKNIQKLLGNFKLKGFDQVQPKDNKVVFVAGATGRVGSRTVRELFKHGFCIRAGTRNVIKAQTCLKDVLLENPQDALSKASSPFLSSKLFAFLTPVQQKVDIVEYDLEDPETIEPALGNSGVVVCCVGASEKDSLNVTAPYRIDYRATRNLIQAAATAHINHFVLVTSLGTRKIGFPASLLNLFWGVLIWKAKAEEALIESGLPYTIIRPGGMERPTDAYKETHNLVLAEGDTFFGGQVSNLQVAELISCCVENPEISKNKVLEVIAETTAPLRTTNEILVEIPENGQRQISGQLLLTDSEQIQAKKLQKETFKPVKKKLLQSVKEEQRMKRDGLRAIYEKEMLSAKVEENESRRAAEVALAKKTELERKLAELCKQAEAAALAACQAKAIEAAVLSAAEKGRMLTEQEKKAIADSIKLETDVNLKSVVKPEATPKKMPSFSFLRLFAPASQSIKVSSESDSKKAMEVPTEFKDRQQLKASSEDGVRRVGKEELKAGRLAEQDAVNSTEAKQKSKLVVSAKEIGETDGLIRVGIKQKKEITAMALAEPVIAKTAQAKQKAEEVTAAKAKEEAGRSAREETEQKEREIQVRVEPANPTEAKKKFKTLATVTAKGEDDKLSGQETKQKQSNNTAAAEVKNIDKDGLEPIKFQNKNSQFPVSNNAMDVTLPSDKTISNLMPSPTRLSPYKRLPDAKLPYFSIPRPFLVKNSQTETSAKEDANADSIDKVETVAALETNLDGTKNMSEEKLGNGKCISDSQSMKRLSAEISSREKEALLKAKAATAFFWPWKRPKPVAEWQLRPSFEDGPAYFPSVSSQQALPPSQTPLSPYTRYEDLKPPASPTPKASSSFLNNGKVQRKMPKTTEALDAQIMSISNGPLQPNDTKKQNRKQSKEDKEAVTEEELRGIAAQQAADIRAREIEALVKAKAAISLKWPWQNDDKGIVQPQIRRDKMVTKTVKAPPMKNSETLSDLAPENPLLPRRSLSPYSRYLDLKPPCSPTPSPARLTLERVAVQQASAEFEKKNEQFNIGGTKGNGNSTDSQLAEKSVTKPPTATFHWPWQ
eukprot:c26437_g1_i1 orf=303-3755(-)